PGAAWRRSKSGNPRPSAPKPSPCTICRRVQGASMKREMIGFIPMPRFYLTIASKPCLQAPARLLNAENVGQRHRTLGLGSCIEKLHCHHIVADFYSKRDRAVCGAISKSNRGWLNRPGAGHELHHLMQYFLGGHWLGSIRKQRR